MHKGVSTPVLWFLNANNEVTKGKNMDRSKKTYSRCPFEILLKLEKNIKPFFVIFLISYTLQQTFHSYTFEKATKKLKK